MNLAVRHVCVRDVMKREFTFIDGKATIYDALTAMRQHKTSVLVVQRRNRDDEYGLLLVSDIARKVLAKGRSPMRVNVYEVMVKPAVYVDQNMDIRYCSRLFARFDLVRALVVDGKEVLGTISPNALVLDGLFGLVE